MATLDWIMTKLLCSSLCLFDTIVKLHAIDKELFNDFLIGSGFHIIMIYFLHM